MIEIEKLLNRELELNRRYELIIDNLPKAKPKLEAAIDTLQRRTDKSASPKKKKVKAKGKFK